MKDYKKILEGVVDIINATEKSDIGFVNICTYIGENCPELKESENERIRKFLIQMAQNGHGEDKDWWNKCVAWLEKQAEQKPAWSEEDEDRLNSCVDAINAVYKWDGMIAWLKSLKERVQPRQEWSEEDEIARNALINLVEMYYGGCINKSEKNRLLDWLKSLRPQNWTKEDKERYISCLQRLGTGNPKQPETINSKWFKEHVYPQSTWKPSEEQMKALKEACDEHWEPDGLDPLYTLYQDLKKLREE